MSVWLELRCEKRGDSEGPFHKCLSNINCGPMGMALDTRTDLIATMQQLEKDARDTGWVKMREGWVCPHCAQHIKAS